MLTFRGLVSAVRKLEIERTRPVIAHASLSTLGNVNGGAQTVLGALLASFNTLVMPTFTYQTMVTPEIGPPDNAIKYGSAKDANLMATFYRPDMPTDRLMGAVAESLRTYPKARRSMHPILSFAGVNADAALDAQSLEEPLLPIHFLKEEDGWVLLVGVNHTVNTSIHYGEWFAGRGQFLRWALTPKGVVECPGFPGCSQGFQAIAPRLEEITRSVEVGQANIQAVPLVELTKTVVDWVKEEPLALLCTGDDCERCNAVRQAASTG